MMVWTRMRATGLKALHSARVNPVQIPALRCISGRANNISLSVPAPTRLTAVRLFSTAPEEASSSTEASATLSIEEELADYYDRPRERVTELDDYKRMVTDILHVNRNKKIYSEISFDNVFDTKDFSSIHDVQHGAYVQIEDEVLKKMLPEGTAGEVTEEFEFSSRNAWMIRPATKVLCRILESFDKIEQNTMLNPSSDRWRPTTRAKAHFEYGSVTDRPEWPEAKLGIKYYNADVVEANNKKKSAEAIAGVLPGEERLGKDVEEWLNQIDAMSSARQLPFPNKVLLTGPRGCGKSTVLNQTVLHARSRGWLCLFIPQGWDYVQSGDYVAPATLLGEDTQIMDNPQMSSQILRGFYRAHADMLAAIPIRDSEAVYKKYAEVLAMFRDDWLRLASIPGRENLPFMQMRSMIEDIDANEVQDALDLDVLKDFDFLNFQLNTLKDLVLLGVAFRPYAGVAALDLIEELKELTSVPVLIAVDEYNTWDTSTAFAYEEVDVRGKDLIVPQALNFISRKKAETEAWQMKNGICIAALSFKHPEGKAHKITYEHHASSVPLVLQVPVYDNVEFTSAAMYYQQLKMLPRSATTHEMMAYRIMTGSNPGKVRKDTPVYWTPIECSKFLGPIDAPEFFLGDEDEPYPNKYKLDIHGLPDESYAEVTGLKKKKDDDDDDDDDN